MEHCPNTTGCTCTTKILPGNMENFGPHTKMQRGTSEDVKNNEEPWPKKWVSKKYRK